MITDMAPNKYHNRTVVLAVILSAFGWLLLHGFAATRKCRLIGHRVFEFAAINKKKTSMARRQPPRAIPRTWNS
jgi:hypothetical protein